MYSVLSVHTVPDLENSVRIGKYFLRIRGSVNLNYGFGAYFEKEVFSTIEKMCCQTDGSSLKFVTNLLDSERYRKTTLL